MPEVGGGWSPCPRLSQVPLSGRLRPQTREGTLPRLSVPGDHLQGLLDTSRCPAQVGSALSQSFEMAAGTSRRPLLLALAPRSSLPPPHRSSGSSPVSDLAPPLVSFQGHALSAQAAPLDTPHLKLLCPKHIRPGLGQHLLAEPGLPVNIHRTQCLAG